MPERPRRWKAVALVLTGMLLGALLVPPVGAHFTQNTKHLGKHAWRQVIKKKVYTKRQVNRRTYTRNQANNRYYTKAQIDRGAAGCQGVPGDVMVKVGGICVDAYEASLWDAPVGGNLIPNTDPVPCDANGQDCDNVYARSVAGVEPRANITWFQAQAALANSGKRLPSNAEWQMTVRGTPDSTACNVSAGSVALTGANPDCVSHYGAFDMVGNLWEQVGDWVPSSTDCPGWGASDDDMCLSGASTTATGPGALLRGGSFPLGAGAGPFAVLGNSQPSNSFSDVGFRGAR